MPPCEFSPPLTKCRDPGRYTALMNDDEPPPKGAADTPPQGAATLAGLLCARLCHDLAAGIGAARNGCDLLAEMDGADAEEARGLIALSADQSLRRLRYLRLAFGPAGPAPEAARIIAAWLADRRVELTAFVVDGVDPATGFLPEPAPEAVVRLMANLAGLVADCLPRGGRVSVRAHQDGRLVAEGTGEDVRDPAGLLAVLAGTLPPAARTAQAALVRILVLEAGGWIEEPALAPRSCRISVCLPTKA